MLFLLRVEFLGLLGFINLFGEILISLLFSKICDIFKSNTVPIYWGSSEVIQDFNPKSFINSNDFSNFDELVEFIKKVDNDDILYASYFKEPIL